MSTLPMAQHLSYNNVVNCLTTYRELFTRNRETSVHITMIQLNVQSLRKKLGLIELMLQDLPVHVFCLNEHWLSDKEIDMYSPLNYILVNYYSRPDSSYGGVAIFLRRDLTLNYEIIDVSDICIPRIFEIAGVSFPDIKLIVFSLYCVPNADIDIIADKCGSLFNILNNYPKFEFVIMGDINVDILKAESSRVRKFRSVLESFDWSLMNNLPTRNEACLDNVIVPCDFPRLSCGTFSPCIADHLGVWIVYTINRNMNVKFSGNAANSDSNTFKIRSTNFDNIANLRSYLSLINFHHTINFTNIDKAWSQFIELVEKGIQEFCPIKCRKKGNRNKLKKCPWYDVNLLHLRRQIFFWEIQAKDKNPVALAKFASLKRVYRNEVHKAKVRHNDLRISISKNKNATAWSMIKEHSASHTSGQNVMIDPNVFNRFFVNNISTEIGHVYDDVEISSIIQQSKSNSAQTFMFSSFSPASVVLAVKRLKSSRSEDAFGMSPLIMKQIFDILLVPLTDLYNLSLHSGYFPSILKNSIVVPIYKKGSRDDPNNYRPIALVPIFSKIFEYLLLDQLRPYFQTFLSDFQFGFRSGCGTSNALQSVVNKILDNMEQRKYTSATLLDLTKAFDSLSHSILLYKLRLYGVSDRDLNLFRTYLSDRKQRVKSHAILSDTLSVNRGVPQGSVLGPFLFIIYMNDFPSFLGVPPIMYADDTTILVSNIDLQELNKSVELEVQRAEKWLNNNELVLNQEKTISITFSLNRKGISTCTSVKLLGLYLDSDMSWNTQIDSLIVTLARNLYLLRRLKSSLSLNFLCLSYHAFFHSHINYSILFWGGATRMQEIFTWQKRAIRTIFGLTHRESCRGKFKTLNILTVPCNFIFLAILYIKTNQSQFTSGTDIHTYNTRNKNLIVKPYLRLTKTNKTYVSIGVKYYNLLPITIKQLPLQKFKRVLKDILIEVEGYSLQEVENYFININMKGL